VAPICTGGEDLDADGVHDRGETDPNDGRDDLEGSIPRNDRDDDDDALGVGDDLEVSVTGGGGLGCSTAPVGAPRPWGAALALGLLSLVALRRRRS